MPGSKGFELPDEDAKVKAEQDLAALQARLEDKPAKGKADAVAAPNVAGRSWRQPIAFVGYTGFASEARRIEANYVDFQYGWTIFTKDGEFVEARSDLLRIEPVFETEDT